MPIVDLNRVKLNTVELEGGLYPNGKIEAFCDKTITGEQLDEDIEFFSLEGKKEAFGEGYKDYNTIIIIDADGKEKEVKIPTIVNGGMGTNVSSASLVEAMNKLGFGGHLSSATIGFYYYYKKSPDYFDKDSKFEETLKDQVQKDFLDIFKVKLGLKDDFINKHFFECNDLGENENNKGFNGELGKARTSRMMDLIAIYDLVTDLKKNGNNVGINCMYKTSPYIAALKISILSGMDYVTTAAGNPTENPKIFLKDFLDELIKQGKNVSLPAFGLLVSSADKRIFKDFDYDYYVFEEGAKAGGHIIRMGDKFDAIKKIKKMFEDKGQAIPPIYAAGGVSTNKEIKEAIDAGFDGIQIGTLAAVSKESAGGDGEQFKKRLIGGNHLGENSQIDEEYFKEIAESKSNIEGVVKNFNSRVLSYLSQENKAEYTEESPEVIRMMNYLYKIVYNDYFDEEIKDFESLSQEEQKFYTQLKTFLSQSYNGDITKINKVLKNYGNAKKFLKEFDTYNKSNAEVPTHVVFDSTVGFPGRMKITKNLYEIIAGEVNSTGCTACLTDCILANRGSVRGDRGSTFCIRDRLNYLNPDRNIPFSGRSTVPYDEIRPIKDIMAYLMGAYVKR